MSLAPSADSRLRASDTSHRVTNQPPPLEERNLWLDDQPLREAAVRHGAAWARDELHAFGALCGRRESIDLGFQANEHPPRLATHDRFGHRIDEVHFHPAYHALMRIGMEAEVHALPWRRSQPGAHVARAVKHYLLTQVEASVLCPLTMTFSAVPALHRREDLAAIWVPRIIRPAYDPRRITPAEKAGATLGMAMTEKQGGSDVRANTTTAQPDPGCAGRYRLSGHKWFCSAPMSDAFLTLAQTDHGLSCFLVPRILEDGRHNALRIMRLKDKLGNRANASAEIEYHGTHAELLGEPGHGIATILEMVSHTRLDCVIGAAGLMRQALAQAMHHTAHRRAFGRRLIEQPLMREVLADLALEVEAATALALRLAAAYDDPRAPSRAFRRLATAASKYWITKRTSTMIAEALECLGGNGYVEESIMPRLYREAPLNSIWEGSGNVMCLDVLRAVASEPESLPALRDELALASGNDQRFDAFVRDTERLLPRGDARAEPAQAKARQLAERLALALEASLLIRHAPPAVADAFVATRLQRAGGHTFGTLPSGLEVAEVLARAWPEG